MTQGLLWVCSTLPPYNSFLFRSLAAQPDIDLLVVVNKMKDVRHPWKTDLMRGFAVRPIRRVAGIDWALLREAVRPSKEVVVIAGWNVPTVILFASLLAVIRAPFVLWTDTPDVDAYRPVLKDVVRTRWLHWLFGRACAVMGTGKPALNALREMGCPVGKLLEFPFFIDIESYHSKRVSLVAQRELHFVSVGRIENVVKGHHLVIEALSRLVEQTARMDWRYIVVGSGPDAAKLRALATSRGLEDRITVTGWLEPDEVRSILLASDVLIHPSLRDAYPAAVLEAMATGIPVLGSDAAGSVLDRVVHMQNGWIHSAGDVDEICDHIEWSLDHRREVAEMGRAARLTAEKWPVSKAVEIITSILTSQKR